MSFLFGRSGPSQAEEIRALKGENEALKVRVMGVEPEKDGPSHQLHFGGPAGRLGAVLACLSTSQRATSTTFTAPTPCSEFDMLSAEFSRRGVLITCPAIVVPAAMCMWLYRVHVMQEESKTLQARIDSLIGRLEAPIGGYRLCVFSMPTYLCLWPSAGDQAQIRIPPPARGILRPPTRGRSV